MDATRNGERYSRARGRDTGNGLSILHCVKKLDNLPDNPCVFTLTRANACRLALVRYAEGELLS